MEVPYLTLHLTLLQKRGYRRTSPLYMGLEALCIDTLAVYDGLFAVESDLLLRLATRGGKP